MTGKYFSQSNWSMVETLLVIAMIALGMVVAVIPNGIPYGGIGLFAVVLVFCFFRSAKVKDSEIDRQINALLTKNGLNTFNTAVSFDFRHTATRLGKDHKLRSPQLWAIRVEDHLTVFQIDLLTEQIKTEIFPIERPLVLTQQTVTTPAGKKSCWFLTGSSFREMTIPVNREDAMCEKLILPLTEDA